MPAKGEYKRRYDHNFTEEEVIQVMMEVIDEYPESEKMYYLMILTLKGLYPNKFYYWRDKSESVRELQKVLEEMKRYKVNEKLMSSNGNQAGLIWYTKTNMKYVAEEVYVQVDANKDIAQMELDMDIKIGYDDDESTD